MKTLLACGCLAAMMFLINACNNETLTPDSADGSARSSATDSLRRGKGKSDSLRGHKPDSLHRSKPGSVTLVDAASLPAAVTAYITTNYTGATIKQAAKDKDGDFIVVITLNNTATVLRFNADGTFDKALTGKGPRGRGDTTRNDTTHRPKPKHTPGASTPGDTTAQGSKSTYVTIDISTLPVAVTNYIAANYAGTTITQAGKHATTGEFLVRIRTTSNRRISLLFAADGTFKKASPGR